MSGWGKPFSEAEDAYLRARVEDGPAVIAKALGRDYSSVRDHMRTMGLILVVRARIAWTEQHDDTLRALCAQRMSDRDISKAMKCSEDVVRARRHELNIVKPKQAKAAIPRAEKRRREETADLERVAAAAAQALMSRDDAFVRRLLQDGGMPRAVATPRGPVWLGADNRPWFGPSRRIAA